MRFLFLLFSVALGSCNNTTTVTAGNSDSTNASMHTTNPADTLITNNTPVMLTGCYEMIINGDTATLRIDLQDSTITGNLNYHFKEKDQNTGTLRGVIRDKYIYADYIFNSEGTTSIREVVFKIEGDILIPGFGDIVEQGTKIIFTDKNALQFQSETPFLKIACPK